MLQRLGVFFRFSGVFLFCFLSTHPSLSCYIWASTAKQTEVGHHQKNKSRCRWDKKCKPRNSKWQLLVAMSTLLGFVAGERDPFPLSLLSAEKKKTPLKQRNKLLIAGETQTRAHGQTHREKHKPLPSHMSIQICSNHLSVQINIMHDNKSPSMRTSRHTDTTTGLLFFFLHCRHAISVRSNGTIREKGVVAFN